MSEPRFKIGDRVVLLTSVGTSAYNNLVGTLATVVEDDHYPWIRFDNPVPDACLDYIQASPRNLVRADLWKVGYMGAVDQKQLVLVERPDAITS